MFAPEFVEIHSLQKNHSIDYDSSRIFIDTAEFSVWCLFRIPSSRLVFLAQDSGYVSSFRYSIEVFDSAGTIVFRDAFDKKALVDAFITASREDISFEGTFSFDLTEGSYRVESTLTDLNTGIDNRLPSRSVVLHPSNQPYAMPVFVSDDFFVVKQKQYFEVANTFGALPFSNRPFGLLLPVYGSAVKKVTLTFTNPFDSVSFVSQNSLPGNYSVSLIGDHARLSFDSAPPPLLFYFPSISNALHEGDYKVAVNIEGYPSSIEPFSVRVAWINKPISLFDPMRATKFITYIDSSSAVDGILNVPDEELPRALEGYWKKFDPTPSTTFNELMQEFYLRIDFANFEFQTIAANDGASTARGKVFVRFGKPDHIERTADKRGKVAEIWNYKKVNRSFIFIDEVGKGDFLLRDSL